MRKEQGAHPGCIESCTFVAFCDEYAERVERGMNTLYSDRGSLDEQARELPDPSAFVDPSFRSFAEVAQADIARTLRSTRELIEDMAGGAEEVRSLQSLAVERCHRGPGKSFPVIGEVICRSELPQAKGFSQDQLEVGQHFLRLADQQFPM